MEESETQTLTTTQQKILKPFNHFLVHNIAVDGNRLTFTISRDWINREGYYVAKLEGRITVTMSDSKEVKRK
jgi:hypothetical protein